MRTRLKVVGVATAVLLGVAVPAAVAQDGDGAVWSERDARGGCAAEAPRWCIPLLDAAEIEEMNERAARLAAFLEEAGIDHEVLTLDVVSWDHSDPEANRAVARFWRRMMRGVPGGGFVPWPVPDTGPGVLDFEGVWPDILAPFLEEWLEEGLPEDVPRPGWFFEWRPGGRAAPEPGGEPEMPLGPELEDLGWLLEELLGGDSDLGALFEEFLGEEGDAGGVGAWVEELLGGAGPGWLEDLFGSLAGADPAARIDEMMAALAEHLEGNGIDTVTIEGPMGVGWVVWDFSDEEAAGLVAEFFADRRSGDAAEGARPGDDPMTWELPAWEWPFDGGDL